MPGRLLNKNLMVDSGLLGGINSKGKNRTACGT